MARILYIDENAIARQNNGARLIAAGHLVKQAATGLEGIAAAKSSEGWDAIVVSQDLPDLDGHEVTLRLRSLEPLGKVPVVLMGDEQHHSVALSVGADGFIARPFLPEDLAALVDRTLDGYRERHTVPPQTEQLRKRSQKIVERLEKKIVELQQANAALEEAMRLRREFLRNLSHELATPMTPVVGYVQMLLDEELGPLTPLQRKSLEATSSSIKRLRGLVDTLLDVSGLETGRLHFWQTSYDFSELVRVAVDDAQKRLAESGVTLHMEELRLEPCRGDASKVRRALAHLLDNAIKFTPHGGDVALGLRSGGRGDDEWIAFIVTDSGRGIPADQIPKIFEAFYQGDGSITREHGGVGLGLAFARRVAEAHGGSVEIHSPPIETVAGKALTGTSVMFRLQRRASLASVANGNR